MTPIIYAVVSLGAPVGLLHLLISFLVLALIIWLVIWIVGMLPLPSPAKQIVMAIVGLILLIWLLSYFGVVL